MADSCDFKMLFIVVIILFVLVINLLLIGAAETSCPNTSATADIKPLYLLTLASIPDDLRALSGARIAQDEINNRTDLLSGYHIELIVDTIVGCSIFEAGIGLSNLVKYTVNPPCRPVVAVNGLGCSSHTSVLSPVAGHDGYDLIQLSSANSPIFQTQQHHFPHLWQFLDSAAVYSDTILAIMDQYNWSGNRIGVVFDVGHILYSGIANDIERKVKASTNKTIKFILAMRKTYDFYLDAAISNIKSQQTTILVSLLDPEQEAALLHRAIDENLVYPDYIWIHVERLPQHLMRARGHICLYTKLSIVGNETTLVSGQTFADFKQKNDEEIKLIEQQYKHYNLTPSVFASYWYDQVWAIALAVNNSLPVLENRNLSIDIYTIGQHEITDVIGEQMANLSFQGASGWVEFNQYHSVSRNTPVEVFWIMDNTTHKLVGFYNPLNQTHFHVDINSSDLPTDSSPRILVVNFLIPLPVAILFYIITSSVVVFTTVQLILYLHYRHHQVIKANSPYLSLLMFVGCYLSCAAAILYNTIGSFILPSDAYLLLSILIIVFIVNSASLVFVTLSAKLVRIYRIFSAWMKRDLGRCWNDCPLVCIVLIFAVVPNIVLAIIFALMPPQHINRPIVTRRDNVIVKENHISDDSTALISAYFSAVYILVFLVLLVYISITSRKNIRIKLFNDSRQVLFLLGVIFVTICITCVLYTVLRMTRQDHLARSIMITGLIVFSLSCQLGLFSMKLVHVLLLENHFSKTHSTFKAMSATVKQTVFS